MFLTLEIRRPALLPGRFAARCHERDRCQGVLVLTVTVDADIGGVVDADVGVREKPRSR
jgi:hypothetical protein